jgi:hypothetical protein
MFTAADSSAIHQKSYRLFLFARCAPFYRTTLKHSRVAALHLQDLPLTGPGSAADRFVAG